MRKTLPLLALLLCGAGWRSPSDTPGALPADWTHEQWSTPVPEGSWSTPVVFGGRVYLTAEPTRLLCLDVETGKILWEREHPTESLLTGDALTTFNAKKARSAQITEELTTLRAREAELRRNVRRGKAKKSELAALETQTETLVAEQDAAAPYFTHPRTDGLGYAVPTPHVDADGVIAAFGTGSVVAVDHDGAPRWQRWLGVGEPPSHGYPGTDSASVVRHDNTVLVAHGALHALDATTGELRWSGPAYPDYGTPTIMESDAGDMVLTPDGHVLDLITGAVLHQKLGALWYLGPTVKGDQIWWIGRSDGAMDKPVQLRRTRLTRNAEGVQTKTDLSMDLPASDRQYAQPIFLDDTLLVVTAKGTVLALDADGTVTSQRTLELKGQVWNSPAVVGDHLVFTTHEGEVAVLKATAPFEPVSTTTVPTTLASLAFVGPSVIARDNDAVHRRGR